MKIEELQAAAEALLFASGEPVTADKLAQALEIDRESVCRIVGALGARLTEQNSGLQIIALEDSFQMCTRPEHAERIRAAFEIKRNAPMSPASMEVLAIIAYNQPVTKAFVEQVRGVDCSGVIAGLCTKGLLEEAGRLELPGRPLLYQTTPNFLRCFGLSSLQELPSPPDRPSEDPVLGEISEEPEA